MSKSGLLGVFLALFVVSPALAQDQGLVKGTFDLRTGWLGVNQTNDYVYDSPDFYDFGFKVNRYLAKSQRLSLYFSFDYLGGGSSTLVREPPIVLEVVPPIDVRSGQYYVYPLTKEFAFLPNVGFEYRLINLPHINLGFHGGVASLITKKSLRLQENYYDSYYNNDDMDLCNELAYSKYCGVSLDALGDVGWNVKFSSHHWKKDSFYGGFGYTFFTRRTRQFVVFAGGTF